MNVFITGASSGIGEALAHAYAKQCSGSRAVIGLAARRVDMLQKLAQNLQEKYQIQTAIYALDVRDKIALTDAANDFIQRFGAPNIVIANAGVSRGTLTEFSEDIAAFQTIMDINLMGMVHTFQPFISAMKQYVQQGHPAQLVGVASVAGIRGLAGAGAYSASKAAVINYLESLRIEMAPHHIHVTTIAPGYVRSPMTDVNQFGMPFLLDADVFAEKFIKAVTAKKRFVVIPWQMSLVVKLMRLVPPHLWDLLSKNAPQKSRET
ncbi:MAG TPA: SDR family oxidoreductase [Methylotenera sp.]|nr:SDR family oxidoreductase [Methylotenera sp.]HPH04676.1 SDR family oxidoreductase [Methylotenera sp.]HPN01477.1 SDR family oxidoreductase [Methylotenera sp.]